MYSFLPSLILGFHGCDRDVAETVLAGKEPLTPSQNDYDWLGHGIYCWEQNPRRALQYAKLIKNHPERGRTRINKPYVLGVVVQPGYCLNLLEASSLELLKGSYRLLKETATGSGIGMPRNIPIGKEKDLLIRKLDCAVIEALHQYNIEKNISGFDTVRGVFLEGRDLYPNAGFKRKNHIQICVRNPNCIKGYFRVRDFDAKHTRP
mgnify:CR=1 FL=1